MLRKGEFLFVRAWFLSCVSRRGGWGRACGGRGPWELLDEKKSTFAASLRRLQRRRVLVTRGWRSSERAPVLCPRRDPAAPRARLADRKCWFFSSARLAKCREGARAHLNEGWQHRFCG